MLCLKHPWTAASEGALADKESFNKPRMAINRVYTRRGDKGETSLVGGERIIKDAPRIDAYGTVDELNAFVGAALCSCGEGIVQHPRLADLSVVLRRVQHELFNLGSILATRPDKVHEAQPRVREVEIAQLEVDLDRCNDELPSLRSFVLPGGTRLSVELHQCRTICRRAERICIGLSRVELVEPESIAYLNRLSDAFFVWSRWADLAQGAQETLWEPNV
ncbi:MAG: cob(I)yrinic acid a,c-diamide adenosyltransferase [Deltaproteobacteria bacterium]|nr:cob(I)yrinic acid a,c-diamide adenosyltransferase [Deltaproteobacteria bacterium]